MQSMKVVGGHHAPFWAYIIFVRDFLVASDRNSPREPTVCWLHTHPSLTDTGQMVPDVVWNC